MYFQAEEWAYFRRTSYLELKKRNDDNLLKAKHSLNLDFISVFFLSMILH